VSEPGGKMTVDAASADVGWQLSKLQREYGLTNIEMLQAVTGWTQTCLKYMLRAERHPDDPDEPAGWSDRAETDLRPQSPVPPSP
jgi:hypothetical protein